jgi:hypothetical protein
VNREKLFQILNLRCKNEAERHIVELIRILHSRCPVKIGSDNVLIQYGVVYEAFFIPFSSMSTSMKQLNHHPDFWG